jgi:hypothetical protein
MKEEGKIMTSEVNNLLNYRFPLCCPISGYYMRQNIRNTSGKEVRQDHAANGTLCITELRQSTKEAM